MASTAHANRKIGVPGSSDCQNLIMVVRVRVELRTTAAGPPLKKCQAEYCSM